MRKFLFAFFYAVLAAMIAVTVTASLERGVFTALADLWSDAWFRATLADAYFGFLTFYCWVAYREEGWIGRIVWLLAILCLGNIATPRGSDLSATCGQATGRHARCRNPVSRLRHLPDAAAGQIRPSA